jgi:hypothetical protein
VTAVGRYLLAGALRSRAPAAPAVLLAGATAIVCAGLWGE